MDDSQTISTVRGVSVVNLLLGAWLIISPYALDYATSQSKWNQTIAGAVVALFALWRMVNPAARWASWIDALAGLWLVITPFTMNYTGRAAYWNEVIVAIILLALSLGNASVSIDQRTHHHAT